MTTRKSTKPKIPKNDDSFEQLEAALEQLNSSSPKKGAQYLESMLGQLAASIKAQEKSQNSDSLLERQYRPTILLNATVPST